MNTRMKSILTGVAAGISGVTRASAQTADVASAGNGGVATSSANGGVVSTGDVNSGGNAGNAIGVGNTWDGSVGVDGGTMVNATSLEVSANGGTAIADASGGNYNLAFVS